MQEIWLKPDEVRDLYGSSLETVRRRAQLGELKFREVKGVNANGRASREYLLSSLPAALQQKFFSRAAALAKSSDDTSSTNVEIIPFRRAATVIASPRIVLPDPGLQAQAEQRLSVIARLVDYEKLSAEEKRSLRGFADDRRINSRDDLARQIGDQTGISRPTILRWLNDYQTGGFSALARPARADKGQSRWFNSHPRASILAAYLYLNERQSVTFVCEQIERDRAQLGIEEGDLPSRETVRIFLGQQISPTMKALAREGQREYRERMSPYLRRMYTDIFANQVWVGDTAILDVEAANDVFPELPELAPLRIRLCAMEDFRSRKIVGANFAVEGSSVAITATMLRGILQFGLPEMIYVDNGKDYKKVAKGTHSGFEIESLGREEFAPIEEKGLLARLEIGVTHCIPRHPQSKHVERFFRTLHTRFDSIHSTYTGGSPATRPDSTEQAMMQHRRLLKKGRGAESHHPYASKIIAGCLSWIEEYNATPHRGEGMDGRSPNEVFDAELNPNQRPTPEPSKLAVLMAEYQRRQVRECSVTLNRRRYVPRNEDRTAWAIMHEQNEHGILIAFNPTDPEFAVALDVDGRFLAWLEAEQLVRFAPNDIGTQKQIGESMEIRRGLEKATKSTLSAIARAARANGAQSAEDALYGRLQLPAAAGEVITHRKPRLAPVKRVERPKTPGEVIRELLAEGA
jgi:transcriptional regulator with XRE-family HTH domain